MHTAISHELDALPLPSTPFGAHTHEALTLLPRSTLLGEPVRDGDTLSFRLVTQVVASR